jgi:hypothetical protein
MEGLRIQDVGRWSEKVVKIDAESKTNAEAMHKMSMVITRCRAVRAARPILNS